MAYLIHTIKHVNNCMHFNKNYLGRSMDQSVYLKSKKSGIISKNLNANLSEID